MHFPLGKRKDGTTLSPRLIWEDDKVSSAMVIEYTALASAAPVELVREVVDGFWDYVTQPSAVTRHISWQKQGRGSRQSEEHRLVIPYFGTFTISRYPQYRNFTRLTFRSQTIQKLAEQYRQRKRRPPSDRWVALMDQEDPASNARLSVKRNMACLIASQRRLNLATCYRVLWHFLETVVRLFLGGDQEIRFFRRGVMYQDSASGRYQMRVFASFSDRLQQSVLSHE